MNKTSLTYLARLGSAIACILAAGCRERAAPSYHQGYVQADMIYVAAPVAGRLDQLLVSKGEQIPRGAPLFRLSGEPDTYRQEEAVFSLRQMEAQLEDMKKGARPEDMAVLQASADQQEAALELARLEVLRITKVFSNSYVSASDHDQAVYAHQQAEAALRQALSQLDQARLGARPDQLSAAEAQAESVRARLEAQNWLQAEKTQSAPRDATVFDTLYREGEWIPAGQPVVALLAPELLRIRFYVGTKQAANMQPGQTIWFAPGPGQPRQTALIRYISPAPEYTPPVIFSRETNDKLVFMIEAVPHDPSTAFHPGLPVEVYLEKENT